MAQSDKDKSNLTSAVPCVCILHNSWPLVAHTSFRHLWPKLPLAYVHVCVCVCVCVCSKTMVSDDDIKTNTNKMKTIQVKKLV